MRRLNSAILLTLLIAFPGSAYCAAADDFDPIQSGIRMLWGLAIVLAILAVIYFVLKKNISAFQQNDKGLIKVLEIKHVLPKKTIMLIEVRGREYLVGAGNDSIGTIVPIKNERSFSSVLSQTEENIPL